MTLKIAILTMVCLSLAGCVTDSVYKNRKMTCEMLSKDQQRGAAWTKTCMTDDAEWLTAHRQRLYTVTPDQLCNYWFVTDERVYQEVAAERKIDCSSRHIAWSKRAASDMSMSDLCFVWSANAGNTHLRKAVRAEVKAREVDCAGLMVAEAQREQARATREAALLGMSSGYNYRPPVTTDCHQIGSTMSCRSH